MLTALPWQGLVSSPREIDINAIISSEGYIVVYMVGAGYHLTQAVP